MPRWPHPHSPQALQTRPGATGPGPERLAGELVTYLAGTAAARAAR